MPIHIYIIVQISFSFFKEIIFFISLLKLKKSTKKRKKEEEKRRENEQGKTAGRDTRVQPF